MTKTIVKTRDLSIDNLRGFAILVMIIDHSVNVFQGPVVIRETITRIAMPIFFLVAGHLVKRFSKRLLFIGILGILLPQVISFIDDPNVLFWYAIFAPVVIMTRKYPVLLLILVGFSLTMASNYRTEIVGFSYWPYGLMALMCLGAYTSRETMISLGKRLPNFSWLGMYPLSFYVGHLAILEIVA